MEQVEIAQQEKQNRYRSSFFATLLFSGVQIYQILIKIIKGKFVALLIGPAGMGIQSLLQSTTDTISAATNIGLNTSSVKTIAAAKRDGDHLLIARNVTTQRRLIWITGIIGMLLCALLAPLWSQLSFGNDAYVLSFICVSLVVLMDQLNRGELALLQGMQQKKRLARANIIGQTLNALVTIPLFFLYGVKAIVAALVLGSLISYAISFYYSHKLAVERVQMSWSETFSLGHEMIKLGFFLSLQYVMNIVVIWIVRNYVSNIGGVDDVGLYSAATAIVGSYIGLVFSAIATDYFPRLAASKGNEELNVAVRTQAELTILLLTPLVVAFLAFCKPVIILLYSKEFLPIENMMYWSIGAVLFQALGWALSYTLLAKAKPSYFFLNELFATAWILPVKLLSYKMFGLTGLGISTLVCYALYLIQVMVVTRKLFGITYDISIWMQFLFLHIPVVLIAVVKLYFSETIGYVTGFFSLIVTSLVIIWRLNIKMDLKSYISIKFTKRKNG